MEKMPHLHEWFSISFNVEEKESKHDNLQVYFKVEVSVSVKFSAST